MAAASCVQEEKEEREAQEPGDAIAQGNNSLRQDLPGAFVALRTHPPRPLETSPHSMCDAQEVIVTRQEPHWATGLSLCRVREPP